MGLFDFFKKDKQSEDNLKKGMKKTSGKFRDGLSSIFLGRKTIDDDLLEELEEFLITADIGPQAADMIIEKVRNDYTRGTLKDSERILDALKHTLTELLKLIKGVFLPCSAQMVQVKQQVLQKLLICIKKQANQ